jgi:hypothetical protein
MVKLPKLTRRTTLILVLAAALLLAAAISLAYFFLPGFGRRGQDIRIDLSLPGQNPNVDFLDPDQVWPGVLSQLQAKSFVDVGVGGKSVRLLADSFTVTKTRDPKDAFASQVYKADDLLIYGAAVAEQGTESRFADFMTDFESNFWTGDLPYSQLESDGMQLIRYGGDDWSLLLRYERALVLAWQRWPTKRIEQSIRRGIDVLKPLFAGDLLGRPADLPPEVTHFWESAAVTPTPLPSGSRGEMILLKDLDVFTLRALSAFDSDFSAYADDWQSVLANGRATVGAPFPAYAIWSDRSGYIFIAEDGFAVNTEDLLITLLHLAEAGLCDEAPLDFFRNALFDDGLSTRYRVNDGSSAGEEADPGLYALCARLGRAAGDHLLTERAKEILMHSYASSQTSLIRGAFYRQSDDDSFVMSTRDNALALLALR